MGKSPRQKDQLHLEKKEHFKKGSSLSFLINVTAVSFVALAKVISLFNTRKFVWLSRTFGRSCKSNYINSINSKTTSIIGRLNWHTVDLCCTFTVVCCLSVGLLCRLESAVTPGNLIGS